MTMACGHCGKHHQGLTCPQPNQPTPVPWTFAGVMNGTTVVIHQAALTNDRPDYGITTAINGGKGCIATVQLKEIGMVEALEPSEQMLNVRLIIDAVNQHAALLAEIERLKAPPTVNVDPLAILRLYVDLEDNGGSTEKRKAVSQAARQVLGIVP